MIHGSGQVPKAELRLSLLASMAANCQGNTSLTPSFAGMIAPSIPRPPGSFSRPFYAVSASVWSMPPTAVLQSLIYIPSCSLTQGKQAVRSFHACWPPCRTCWTTSATLPAIPLQLPPPKSHALLIHRTMSTGSLLAITSSWRESTGKPPPSARCAQRAGIPVTTRCWHLPSIGIYWAWALITSSQATTPSCRPRRATRSGQTPFSGRVPYRQRQRRSSYQ